MGSRLWCFLECLLAIPLGNKGSHCLTKTGTIEHLLVMARGMGPRQMCTVTAVSLEGLKKRQWWASFQLLGCAYSEGWRNAYSSQQEATLQSAAQLLCSEVPRFANETRRPIDSLEGNWQPWQTLFKNNKWTKGWFHPNRMPVQVAS